MGKKGVTIGHAQNKNFCFQKQQNQIISFQKLFILTKHHMFGLSYECFSISCFSILLKSVISSHNRCTLKQTGLVFSQYQKFLMQRMVCSVCYLGCIVIYVNALFSEWRITKRDYFWILLLAIFSGMEPAIYFQI